MATILAATLTAFLTVGLGIIAFEYQQRWQAKLKYIELIIIELESMAESGKKLINSINYEIHSNVADDDSDDFTPTSYDLDDKKLENDFVDSLEKIKSYMPILGNYISQASKLEIEHYIEKTKRTFQDRHMIIRTRFEPHELEGWFFSYEAGLDEEISLIKGLIEKRFELFNLFEKELNYLHIKITKRTISLCKRYLKIKFYKIRRN